MKKISKVIRVGIGRDKSFSKFLNQLNEWWPKEYTWSQDKLKEIRIEEKKDGLCTEIGPHGFRCDWGRVTELAENQKIIIKWQISPKREPVPNPEKASEVEIIFKENGNSATTVELEHRNFENHGDGWEAYLKIMDSEQGWEYILNRFRKYCES
ncbi:MAG: SRPBCC family protein [Prolixibacteraceae bacterium]